MLLRYRELQGGVWDFVKLCKEAKAAKMGASQVINLLKIANHYLPSVQRRYNQLQNENKILESIVTDKSVEVQTQFSISIIALSHGVAATFIVWLCLLFFSWYKSNRSLIVLLYFVALSGIAFNLIMAAAFVGTKVTDRPNPAAQYVGSSGDISGGKHEFL
jgi:hypothetical protein